MAAQALGDSADAQTATIEQDDAGALDIPYRRSTRSGQAF
jgi:hypothetical protein